MTLPSWFPSTPNLFERAFGCQTTVESSLKLKVCLCFSLLRTIVAYHLLFFSEFSERYVLCDENTHCIQGAQKRFSLTAEKSIVVSSTAVFIYRTSYVPAPRPLPDRDGCSILPHSWRTFSACHPHHPCNSHNGGSVPDRTVRGISS